MHFKCCSCSSSYGSNGGRAEQSTATILQQGRRSECIVAAAPPNLDGIPAGEGGGGEGVRRRVDSPFSPPSSVSAVARRPPMPPPPPASLSPSLAAISIVGQKCVSCPGSHDWGGRRRRERKGGTKGLSMIFFFSSPFSCGVASDGWGWVGEGGATAAAGGGGDPEGSRSPDRLFSYNSLSTSMPLTHASNRSKMMQVLLHAVYPTNNVRAHSWLGSDNKLVVRSPDIIGRVVVACIKTIAIGGQQKRGRRLGEQTNS